MQSLAAAETGLAITNPLVLYRALVATKKIHPDPAQHRLALHLQKLYHRLKDYEPAVEYRVQLEQVTRTLDRSFTAHHAGRTVPRRKTSGDAVDNAGSGGRRLSELFSGLKGFQSADSLALTRRLSSHEAALHLDSPQGLLLYGEVGTGKSMLVDLLADSLPNRKKRRYHFNAFMLDLFARIEQQRILRSSFVHGGFEPEHTLLAMARDMISTSPILFLDEFQLPDRAASKIIASLFTSFFQLGGVLIATSNRMPEELSKASGIEYAVPSSPTTRLGFSGLRSFLSAAAKDDPSKGVNSRQNDFTQFLDVLKARCETWNMESKIDFRRRESGSRRSRASRVSSHKSEAGDLEASGGWGEETKVTEEKSQDESADSGSALLPAFYFHSSPDSPPAQLLREESEWQRSLLQAAGREQSSVADVPWREASLNVYGRKVGVPKACNGTSMWTFGELCGAYLGPADYITLASTFHTLVLTDVPVLHIVQKNEARRFITLLDALYESRCRLLVRAEASPDDLFFPDQRRSNVRSARDGSKQEQEGDSVYAETLSEIYQDAASPFRPNVSAYGTTYQTESTPRQTAEPHRTTRSILADEDADFGPVYGAGRSAGASTHVEPAGTGDLSSLSSGPNFQKTDTFTGQDERFAYRRAESRLWELCSNGWWERAEQGSLWKPLSSQLRAWETSAPEQGPKSTSEAVNPALSPEHGRREEDVFRHGASPFRVVDEPPPKLSWTHTWGLMKWGRKAGTWGQGTEGIEARAREKRRERAMLEQQQARPRPGPDSEE